MAISATAVRRNSNKQSISTLSDLTQLFLKERTTKLGAGESALKEVMGLFGPSYMKGEEQKTLAGAQADLFSRGLAGTTIPSAMSVGVKRQYEDIRKTRLADALSSFAQFLGQTAPTAPTVAGLATSTNQALRQSRTYGGYSPNPAFSPTQWANLSPSQRHYAMPGQIGAYTGL